VFRAGRLKSVTAAARSARGICREAVDDARR
jgi:hypothetical protein